MDDVIFGISLRESTHLAQSGVRVEMHFPFIDLIKGKRIV